MNDKLLESLQVGWDQNLKVGTASMTLGGRIQFAGSKSEKKKHLDRIKFAADSELEGDTTSLEGDFVDVTYRALTAAMMGDLALDFSNEAMLRRSVPLLKGQTVFKDHNTLVDNWVGQVVDTFWDDKTKGLPPGINSVLRLDTVKDPMTVRGVLQGALHSASVTVSFEWKPSHPKLMDEDRFWNNLGEEVEGEMVRIVVTKIVKYWEISLVWQGADEYAKQIDAGGKPLNRYSFVADPVAEQEDVALSAGESVAENFEQEESMKLKTELEKLVGAVTDDTVCQAVETFAQQKVEAAAAVSAKALELANAECAELKAKLEELESRKSELSEHAALGKTYIENLRQEVVTLYKKAKGDKAVKEVFLKTFEKAGVEILKAWKEDYEAEIEEKFPLSCKKCGQGLTRQSAQLEEAVDGKVIPFSGPAADAARNLHG